MNRVFSTSGRRSRASRCRWRSHSTLVTLIHTHTYKWVYTMFDIPKMWSRRDPVPCASDPHGRIDHRKGIIIQHVTVRMQISTGTSRPCNFTNHENIIYPWLGETRNNYLHSSTVCLRETSPEYHCSSKNKGTRAFYVNQTLRFTHYKTLLLKAAGTV